MMSDIERRQKKKILERFLEDDYILVQVNTSYQGLELPDHLLHLPSVTLKLSRLFRGAMEVTSKKISADLLFNGAYFTCIIPLDAVWAASAAKGPSHQWRECIPKSLPEEQHSSATEGEKPQKKAPQPEPLRSVSATHDSSKEQEKPTQKARPQLRRVK